MNGPVICGIEDAENEAVVNVAYALAERYDIPLHFVHVIGASDEHEDAARLVREASASGNGEVGVESGHPADRLVELARDRDASFLVVGNHGPRSSLLGSVSADVSRRAPCPVVVVPPTANVLARAPASNSRAEAPGGIVRFALSHAPRTRP